MGRGKYDAVWRVFPIQNCNYGKKKKIRAVKFAARIIIALQA